MSTVLMIIMNESVGKVRIIKENKFEELWLQLAYSDNAFYEKRNEIMR